MHHDVRDLFRLDADAAHGHGRIGVVVPFAEDLEAHAKVDSLDVAERLSQRPASVVAGKVDGGGPGFHQPVDGAQGQRLAALA